MKTIWLSLLLLLLPLLAHSQEKTSSITDSALITLAGDTITQADLQGKVVVLNFWFMSCGPCLKEIPDLHRLQQKYQHNQQVRFIAISLMDELDKIAYFISRKPFGYEHATKSKVWNEFYNVSLFPTNIVVNPQGQVVYRKEGFYSSIFEELDAAIQQSIK